MIMDQMDIDRVMDIPVTPDGLGTRMIGVRNGVEEEYHDTFVVGSGSRRPPQHPPKYRSSSSNSLNPISYAAVAVEKSLSSKNAALFRKGMTEKSPSSKSHDTTYPQHLKIEKPCSSRSSSDNFMDRKVSNLRRPVSGNASPGEVTGNYPAEFRTRSKLANGPSSSHGLANNPTGFGIASQAKNAMSRFDLNVGYGDRIARNGNTQNRPGNNGFPSFDPTATPRVNRQKRLVRNGCISPNNIAKAKQVRETTNGSVDMRHNNNGSMTSIPTPVSIDIREFIAEDNNSHTVKGKGVVTQPPPKETDPGNKDLHSRSFRSSNEKVVETSYCTRSAGKSIEETGDWRSKRNATKKMNLSSFVVEKLVREVDVPRHASEHHENMRARREKGGMETTDNYPKDKNVYVQPLRQSTSKPRAQPGQLDGHCSVVTTFTTKQKQGSTSRCSTSVSGDPEVVFLSSSAGPSNSRSTSSSMENSQTIIEVGEFSPELGRNSHDEDARLRQVEADEVLARELQEQFYNEVPILGVGEVDTQIALALEHQDDSDYAFSRRGSLRSNSRRQRQSRPPSNRPRRRSQARASTSRRMTRLRGRFPGQPRSLLPTRGGNSLFPANMDADMRHLLGALETLSDLGVSSRILQTRRNFNENDYEMLLSLDENNNQHGGASVHHINGLPQSTVQTDNFEEACAICLETPTIGDIIRHLPCLHKFHKDCIDLWLRRKPSCPVCKSSTT
ncbi:E3 ubiquitin-protein ligase RLIM isoform X1 [Sesamum indicum]|uniref:E3 ubiquitin-protein ligase RLIM isoform X1 n=2 Tax=Sesamum indicum TaxID=4182 RepID=A0A8M8V8U3_SESIN|nr:E3 ubiquitin-protein ligase RLIM isoform X1 [Sesamum indicum]